MEAAIKTRLARPQPADTNRAGGRQTRFWSSAVRTCARLPAAGWLLGIWLLLPAAVSGQPAAPLPVWGLSPGDRFVVRYTVVRESSIQIGDTAATESTLTDEFDVEYFVTDTSRAGDARFRVRIDPQRRVVQPEDAQMDSLVDRRLPLLEDLELLMLVGPDGIVDDVSNYRQSLQNLAGPDQENQQSLLATVSDMVAESWFAEPFWLTASAKQLQPQGSWDRIEHHSLGLLGGLRTIVTLTVDEIDTHQARITIQGASRSVPLSPGNFDSGTSALPFSDVKVAVESYTGTAVMKFSSEDLADAEPQADVPLEEPEPEPESEPEIQAEPPAAILDTRPWFESLTVELRYSGSAQVSIGEQQSALQFQQTETRSCKLISYQLAQPLLDIPNLRPQTP